jgi:hypothetical protein
MRHWKVGPDYYVGVDLAYESTGDNIGGFGYSAAPATWLQTNPQAQDFQLAIGYDGPSHALSVGLYDASGTPLIERLTTLEALLPGTTGEAAAINNMALTHLGWEDYSGNLTDQTTVWQNDALTYFDTADGAKNAVTNLLAKAWAVNADGNWLDGGNWTPAGAPNGPGAAATFGSIITAPRTVTVSGTSPVVGDITFNSAQKYTIAGNSFITLNKASGATITDSNGSHEIAVPLTFASGTNLTVEVTNAADKLTLSSDLGAAGGSLTKTGAGTFELLHARAGVLNIIGGTVKLTPSGGALSGAGTVGGLTIIPGAKLDLTDNKVAVTGGNVGTAAGGTYDGISGLVQSGRNGGDWSGSGIITSIATSTTTIGVATAQQALGLPNSGDTGTWAGQTVTGTDALVMYTYGGDANLDGKVTISDYGKIDFNIGIPGASGWANGDFNYDGKVTISDYGIIDFVIGIQGPPFPTSGGASSGLSAVPEPSAAMAIAAGGLSLLVGRRSRRHRHTFNSHLGITF